VNMRTAARGFTLVEVLIATFITALALAAALVTVSGQAGLLARLERQQQAARLIEQQLGEWRALSYFPAEGEISGAFAASWQPQGQSQAVGWQWRCQVGATASPNVRELRCTVLDAEERAWLDWTGYLASRRVYLP